MNMERDRSMNISDLHNFMEKKKNGPKNNETMKP